MNTKLKTFAAGNGDLPHRSPLDLKEMPQVFGIDRCAIWLDVPDVKGLERAMKPHCRKFMLIPRLMYMNANWKCLVQLHQPTLKGLQVFDEHLSTSIRAMPNHCELVWDICPGDSELALAVAAWRRAHLQAPWVRGRMERFKHTDYYNKRSGKYDEGRAKADRRGRVLAAYAHRRSKLLGDPKGPPCAHMEMRLSGAAELQSAGIFSVRDMLAFDHQQYWRRAVRFFELPKKTELGRLLYGRDHDEISGSALRKKASKFIADHSIKGQFVMHNALKSRPDLQRKFHRISVDDVMRNRA